MSLTDLPEIQKKLLKQITNEDMPDKDFVLACKKLSSLLSGNIEALKYRRLIERELLDHLFGLKRCGITTHDEGMMDLFAFKRRSFMNEKLIEIIRCPVCNGKGFISQEKQNSNSEQIVCARCDGNCIV